MASLWFDHIRIWLEVAPDIQKEYVSQWYRYRRTSGHPVFAARGGTVKYAGWKSDYGNLIIIDHGGYQTYYAHLSKINVYVGLRVEKGDFIARSGNTGTSTGPHLHFEVRKSDELEDPVAYLPRTNTYVMRRVLSELILPLS